MSFSILVQGPIVFGDPKELTAKNGSPFVVFKIKAAAGQDSHIVAVRVFSEPARKEALRLREGDSVAAQGVPQFGIYQPEAGSPRVNLSMTADMLLAGRQPPKPRAKREAAPSPAPTPRAPERGGQYRNRCGAAAAGLDDSIPF